MRYQLCAPAAFVVLAALSAASSEDRLQVRCPPLHDKTDQPVTVEVTGPKAWSGKPVALRKGGTTVCAGEFIAAQDGAVAKLAFDPLPWGIRPDVLDVTVAGEKQSQFPAPLVFLGMRGNPPKDEVLAALKSPGGLFPMIDRFGQYRHRDWPGKTATLDDLRRQREAERRDLQDQAGPSGWDTYGGWMDGPQLRGTGFFRVEKHQGRWWLVDPDGSLFWSHGIDCVRSSSGTTPLADRMHYFEPFPAAGTPEAMFLGQQTWAPKGYYQRFQGRPFQTFNFTGVNLLRKYGPAWPATFAQLAHVRLCSWGMNTIGNWSDPDIYLLRKTPYVATCSPGGRDVRQIQGSTGYWGKFPDPFDPGFRAALRRALDQEQGKATGDPWCLGFFVHNELGWGDETSLAIAALASPPGQPAKEAFLSDLKKKYAAIEPLNAAWGTKHGSWDALAVATDPPDKQKAGEDLKAFYTRLAEEYFRTCREEVHRAAPHQLYLGCRFAWVNDRAALAAAKYCDVIAYNLYKRDIAGFRLPAGIDKPVIVGEFHFGALDRGLFHPGLQKTANQQERAAMYKSYVQGALRNPAIVGTHFFQYGDQATTGRGDGENYQIGFLDICDTPYPETIAACRDVGYTMYPYRAEKGGTTGE
ncbi:MAG: beta-agarase [Candidatus Anammoximicrobium sp.]|nr:beta-agarase [Candidatus Anammoximicrobium sp.]